MSSAPPLFGTKVAVGLEHIGCAWVLGDACECEGAAVDQPRAGMVMFASAENMAPARTPKIMSVAKGPGMRASQTWGKMSGAAKTGIRLIIGVIDPPMGACRTQPS